MEMQPTASVPQRQTHTYSMKVGEWVGALALFAVTFIFLLAMNVALLTSAHPPARLGRTAFLLGMFAVFDIILWLVAEWTSTRLVTAPTGIAYYWSGVQLRAPWESIIGTGVVEIKAGKPVDALIVRGDAAEVSALMKASMVAGPIAGGLAYSAALSSDRYLSSTVLSSGDIDATTLTHAIPVGWFSYDWRHDAIGEDVRRYAPWVFAESESHSRKVHEAKRVADETTEVQAEERSAQDRAARLEAAQLPSARPYHRMMHIMMSAVAVELAFTLVTALLP